MCKTNFHTNISLLRAFNAVIEVWRLSIYEMWNPFYKRSYMQVGQNLRWCTTVLQHIATLQVTPKFGRVSTTSQTGYEYAKFRWFFFSKFVAVSMVDILKARSRKWNWVHHCISLYPADVRYVNYRPMQD